MARLLIITQKVDQNDPILGFFHRWLEILALHHQSVTVICLEQGSHVLPAEVNVLSLGKEQGRSRIKYLVRLVRYLWQFRSAYDTVFVHMNQEYVLLAGWWWRLTGKRILLWRNHPRGSWLTDWAVMIAHRVFCTSPFSYTARFKKTTLMPVGIDTELFKPQTQVIRRSGSVLSLGRVAPIKKLDLILTAIAELRHEAIPVEFTLVGRGKEPTEMIYQEALERQIRDNQIRVTWLPSVAHSETIRFYNEHDIFVNLTPTGSMDKTIFEAMASGAIVLVSNQSLVGYIPSVCLAAENNGLDVALKLKALLMMNLVEKDHLRTKLRTYVEQEHSLTELIKRLNAYA